MESRFDFKVLHKKDMTPVRYSEILKKKDVNTESLIECDLEGWGMTEDGTLILCDECGNYAYVPREEKYIIRIQFGSAGAEILY